MAAFGDQNGLLMIVAMGVLLIFLCICCMHRICQKKKLKTSRVVMYAATKSRSRSENEYLQPFLGPPNYEQPRDEPLPPAYRHLPSAPPLELEPEI